MNLFKTTFPLFFSALFSFSNAVAADNQMLKDNDQYTCESSSFPEQLDTKIYRQGDRYFAQLYSELSGTEIEYDNDGDADHVVRDFADDVIELVLIKNDASGLVFAQKPDGRPTDMKINVLPNGKTTGAVIKISTVRGEYNMFISQISAQTGPLGRPAQDSLLCW